MNHAVLCACEDCLYEIGQSDGRGQRAEVAAEGAWLRVAEARNARHMGGQGSRIQGRGH
jgi:hypothetical protein